METVSFVCMCSMAMGCTAQLCEAEEVSNMPWSWTLTTPVNWTQSEGVGDNTSLAADVSMTTESSHGDSDRSYYRDVLLGRPLEHQTSVLPVVMTSAISGYVTSRMCNATFLNHREADASYKVVVPAGHVTLISFPVFDLKWDFFREGEGFVELASVHADGIRTPLWRYSSPRFIRPRLYITSVLIRLLVPPGGFLTGGFKMIFSVHPIWQTPPEISTGVFNCSVPFYHTFQHHFHCNLEPECPGGEDEGGHCPFSSHACKGRIATGNKCFFHVRTWHLLSWRKARMECQKQGGDLAILKTPVEKDVLHHLLQIRNVVDPVFMGMQSFESSMPRIYAKSHVWLDNTINYQFSTRSWTFKTFYGRICFIFVSTYLNDKLKNWFCYVPCNIMHYTDFVCQVEVQNASKPLMSFLKVNKTWTEQSANQFLTVCPGGHVTHTFLSCDAQSHCGTNHYVSQCTNFDAIGPHSSEAIMMFVCDDSFTTLHYTLVCDFREDCKDRSDELFCEHNIHCLDFACHNGQCVDKREQCNGVEDCWDGSDELCTYYLSKFPKLANRLPPPVQVTFQADGTVIQTKISGCDACPQTHVCCAEGYCVPVYCRCNGLGDCVHQEDEEGCQHYQCPGFYRCWFSTVCVHADHLCDGWPQCPKHDDEWLCKTTCPVGCLCQGRAFRCLYPVSLTPFPLLRYLDAGGSGMEPPDVTGLLNLAWLSLSRCAIKQASKMNLPNLIILDMSQNHLTLLHMNIFLSLRNLRHLNLSKNPLESVFSDSSESPHMRLISVDMSGSLLSLFNSSALFNYPSVYRLDLSHGALTRISQNGFRPLPNLKSIDLRGNDIREYPSDIFQHLDKLEAVFAGQYKLCCKELLPHDFDEKNCIAPRDEISSCADLLRSDTYRTFLWLFSVLSIIGNMGCLLTRAFLLKSKSVTAFSIFVNNLSIADLIMGVYLTVVGAADHVYRGRYFWFEESWKPSVACQLAGFLSLLSCETSALIICLITLDRFLVLSSPFGQLHFRRGSAAVACLLVWLLGWALASVPLLPLIAPWDFYSQTGICIPLPITRNYFKGRDYAFGILIVFNLVLFTLIAGGQAMIYWTIRTTRAVRSTAKKNKDLTIARRLLSVVVSDFLCWFPIGLLGLLAANGMPVPGEVNVGMAIFVLPLNAALNPFLYTFSALMDIWKKREEDRLLKQLQACTVTDTGCL